MSVPSAVYWDARYRSGGNSGAGSYGRLADYKAGFINAFVADNAVRSVADLGCGDGNLLSLLRVPGYTGFDVSPAALARCRDRFSGRYEFRAPSEASAAADLALSVDVIFHLIEDDVFAGYMTRLFEMATRFVLIYASNTDLAWADSHVRHRRFTVHVADACPGWRLAAHAPNPHAYDPARRDETSFADFFVYTRGERCTVRL